MTSVVPRALNDSRVTRCGRMRGGFVAEAGGHVEHCLDSHLAWLAEADVPARAIVAAMQVDAVRHLTWRAFHVVVSTRLIRLLCRHGLASPP